MRKPVIAGNWKLFKTNREAETFVWELAPLVSGVTDVEIVIAPVFTALTTVSRAMAGTGLKLAAQDCFWETEGAFTGEVSPALLRDAGCTHVIIGHSERRQYFGETDSSVNLKLKAALEQGLTVLFCIGETLVERESGETFEILASQVTGGLAHIPVQMLSGVIIAYEPVWAIGTGKTATDEQAQEAHAFIRSTVADLYGKETAAAIRILYGGSVKPDNIAALMAREDIDGALVGGASLKADSFAAIVNYRR
jgi:triosephosphate isomerase